MKINLLVFKLSVLSIFFNVPENNTIEKKNNEIENLAYTHLGLVKIKIDNSSSFFQTDIYFNTNGTLGLDLGYDASLFGGTAPAFSVYTHLVEGNTGVPMAIQALGGDAMNNVVVPLGLHTPQGQNINISLKEITLPAGTSIYLEDRNNNIFTLLNENDYNFYAEQDLTQAGRFFLHFETFVLNTAKDAFDDLSIYTNQNEREILIEGKLQERTIVKIYDINGKFISAINLQISSTTNKINANQLNSGIYILQIESGLNKKRVQKIVLE